MKKFLFSLFLLICYSASAQYCVSGGPTTINDSNVELVKLTGTTDSISFVGCPGVIGVQDLTSMSVTLSAGSSYTLNVQFGTCGGNYAGAGTAWIDFDNSYVFDAWDTLGSWAGIPPTPLSVFSFTVPLNAHNGTTRMRVMQKETGILPLDPCDSFSWGSVTDFTIIITGGLDCSGYPGMDMANPKVVPSLPFTDQGSDTLCYSNRFAPYPSPDVFYRILPSSGSDSIHVSLCGSNFDTFLSIANPQKHVIAYNDDGITCAPQSELSFSTAGLDTAFVIIQGWGTAKGNYTIHITETFPDPSGIEELFSESISVFPNPAQLVFVISGNHHGVVRITDLPGNTVSQIQEYHGEQIAINHLTPGIYFVRLYSEKRNYSGKIIIIE